jgi:HEAT repeat protein
MPQTKASPSRNPANVRDWANRLLAKDPKIRAAAGAALVQQAPRSFPLLKRFLTPEHEDLHAVTFQIIQRIGPPAIPLLVDLLRHQSFSIRRSAVDELIDLAPHTESVQPSLRRALRDDDSAVAGDAARALGALGKRASPSVGALVTTLSHEDPYVRIYAAEALASIGPGAATATNTLAEALGDPVPGVRWAACEALASIGPAAQSAVPQLIEALDDEYLYVRIFAAGALGSIGPKAQSAREALKASGRWIESQELDQSSLSLHRACPRRPSRLHLRPRSFTRAILQLTGIRRQAGTSSGAASWATRRSVVP